MRPPVGISLLFLWWHTVGFILFTAENGRCVTGSQWEKLNWKLQTRNGSEGRSKNTQADIISIFVFSPYLQTSIHIFSHNNLIFRKASFLSLYWKACRWCRISWLLVIASLGSLLAAQRMPGHKEEFEELYLELSYCQPTMSYLFWIGLKSAGTQISVL